MDRKAKSFANNLPCNVFASQNIAPPTEHRDEKPPVKFCLYARKSSESDERQALSIESQIKEMLQYAKREGIKVQEILEESHSAKDSGQRPVFNSIIKRIKKGEFTGIMTWATDRLSRNAGDLGVIVDLMDDGYLEEIRTYNQKFHNSPNEKFLLMILGSQAKLENDNRGVNAKRGMRTKCEMGYRPNMAPLGFLNNKANHTIRRDPKRAPIIQQIFEKVAYEGWTGREIYTWLDGIGFRTRKGKKVSYSTVYQILNEPYYCGIFEFPKGSGKWYKTKHKPIITRQLFEDVQKCLVVHFKTWHGTKVFDFTKMLKCGACGSGITAQEKIKNFKNGNKPRYVYYMCTRFRDLHYKQPYTSEKELINQLRLLMDRITIGEIKEIIDSHFSDHANMAEFIIRNELNREGMQDGDYRKLAKSIVESGPREDKRNLLKYLNTTIYLKDKLVYINNEHSGMS